MDALIRGLKSTGLDVVDIAAVTTAANHASATASATADFAMRLRSASRKSAELR